MLVTLLERMVLNEWVGVGGGVMVSVPVLPKLAVIEGNCESVRLTVEVNVAVWLSLGDDDCRVGVYAKVNDGDCDGDLESTICVVD